MGHKMGASSLECTRVVVQAMHLNLFHKTLSFLMQTSLATNTILLKTNESAPGLILANFQTSCAFQQTEQNFSLDQTPRRSV